MPQNIFNNDLYSIINIKFFLWNNFYEYSWYMIFIWNITDRRWINKRKTLKNANVHLKVRKWFSRKLYRTNENRNWFHKTIFNNLLFLFLFLDQTDVKLFKISHMNSSFLCSSSAKIRRWKFTILFFLKIRTVMVNRIKIWNNNFIQHVGSYPKFFEFKSS